jgi:hypothetical protein
VFADTAPTSMVLVGPTVTSVTLPDPVGGIDSLGAHRAERALQAVGRSRATPCSTDHPSREVHNAWSSPDTMCGLLRHVVLVVVFYRP